MSAPHLRLVDRIVNEHGEIVDCPHCAAARAEAEEWKQEVLKLKSDVRRLKEDKAMKAREDDDYPAAYELFDEWRRETGHPRAKFEGDIRRVQRALSVIRLYREDREKLSWVIQYGKHLAPVWRGEKQDSWGLLFRDADHIEKYARAWWTHCRRNGGRDGGS
jgi:hypothetical protein